MTSSFFIDCADWRELKGMVNGPDEAISFVEQIGFCTMNLKEKSFFPHLSYGYPEGVEEPPGLNWYWKDYVHIERKLFYTRLFFKKPGLIAPDLLPCFLATSGRASADELFDMGRLSADAYRLYQLIERNAPISPGNLRARNGMTSAVLQRHLEELEGRMLICKVDIPSPGSGHYYYIWGTTLQHFPEAHEESAALSELEAARRIMARMRAVNLRLTPEQIAAAFRWPLSLALQVSNTAELPLAL